MRTLLLTPWYLPIKVLRWQDAVKMLYEGTVESVVDYDEEIRSPSVTWQMPAVVRLKKLSRKRTKDQVKFSRQNVYARDGFRCQYCGDSFSIEDLSYDHVVPRSAGGRRTWTNIVTACKPCNLRKGNRTCDETSMWPLQSPRQPISLPLTSPLINRATAPEEWHDFLGAWAR